MFEPLCMFRDTAAGALAADATLPAAPGLDMLGPDLVERTVQIHVPALGAPGDTLDVSLLGSDDGITFVEFARFPQILAAGEYYLRTICNKRYRQAFFDTSVGGAWGIVRCGYIDGGFYNKG